MAGCVRKCGSVSPESRKRYTESLANVLASSDGQERFRSFLESRGFVGDADTLTFWALCNKLINRHHGANITAYRLRKLKMKTKRVAEFAEEQDVNLDAGELERLHSAADCDDAASILGTLEDARQSAFNLLGDKHSLFCVHLLKSRKT
ncbi:uncharacterized protein LOC134534934 [Bacillus rossius redtenbacheri]|uniref:uncharacterized protein LOC134534934 n=1 Tax=Bacillus rossius redtenbacheri TaxID=93214 RepID=UPI002FDD7DDC